MRGARSLWTWRRGIGGLMGAGLCLVALMIGPGRAQSAGITPTCQPGSGVLQIVGLTMTYTAHSGVADNVTVAMTGGTWTAPNTGVPLTQANWRIIVRGGSGFSSVETYCASDPSATCAVDSTDPEVVDCTAIVEEIDVFTGDKDDTVDATGVPAPVVMNGGGNNDILRGGTNDDSIGGGDGADEVYGNGGNDTLSGGPVGDYVEGGAGNDTLSGDGGADTIKGGPGQDTLDGGADIDTLDYSDMAAGVTADLQAAVATGSTTAGPAGDLDTIRNNFENIAGGSGNDTLAGQDGDIANVLQGGPGNDVLNGGGGDDNLQGGDGDDILIDTNEDAGGLDDTFQGGAGADRLIGGTGNNRLFGDDGDDWLTSGCATAARNPFGYGQYLYPDGSLLDGGNGDDTLSNAQDCSAFSYDGRDGFVGGTGDDTLDFCAADNPRSTALPLGYRPVARRAWTSCARTRNQTIDIGEYQSKNGSTADLAAEYGLATGGDSGSQPGQGRPAELDTVDVSIENAIGGSGGDVIERASVLGSRWGYLNGSTGPDVLKGNSQDSLDGGPGGANDAGDVLGDLLVPFEGIADYSLRTNDVQITLDGLANDGEPGEADDVLVGDVTGGAGNDVITAFGGRNTLRGGAGNDKLIGGAGPDIFAGGTGNDELIGGPGIDFFHGDADDDFIDSRDGNTEFLNCDSGNDVAKVDRGETPYNCETVHVGVDGTLSAGGSITTDVEGDGATPAHPVEVSLTTPVAGDVDLEEGATTAPNPTGFTLLGKQYTITAPAATAANPLVISFRIDASQVPAGQDENSIFLYKDSQPVPRCNPSPPRPAGTADPATCIDSQTRLADGDILIVVLTTTASVWNFAVDITPPTISIATPPQDATYLLKQIVNTSYSCADDGSGLKSCVGTVPKGSALDTATVGSKTFTVNAADNVGNTSSQTRNYRVIYDFKGFFAPLQNSVLNVVRAGAAVPVRFSLTGFQGLAIFDVGSPQSTRINCDGSAVTSSVDETVTASASGLVYDAGSDTYSYVWKTDTSWAGTCRALDLRLNDGTDHLVDFQFRN